MALDFSLLFTKLGKQYRVLFGAHVYAGGNLATYFGDAITALGTDTSLLAPLPAALANAQSQAWSVGQTVRSVMAQTLLSAVNADSPQPDRNSVPLALAELIRQMKAGGASVSACTVGMTAAAASGNSGNGILVLTSKLGDGLVQQNAFAEVGELVCTADAQGGNAAAGGEPWTYRGDYATPDVLSIDWPGFSGSVAGLTTIDSQAAGGNLLRNGSFDTFTVTNVPDNWAMTGTVATNYAKETSVVHRGAAALKFIGDGATLTGATQTFSANVIRPNRVYAANLWVRLDASAVGGQLTLDLYDGAAVINDDQGVPNSITYALSSLAIPTAYAPLNGVFRTPRVLPATVKFRVRLSVALASGRTLYLDSLAMGEVSFLYAGGPAISVFAGSSPWITGDRYAVTVTNDRAGSSYGATWQTVFDRSFGMRQLGLMLPYSASSPTIADSLLTS
jgi:hypothetical protein